MGRGEMIDGPIGRMPRQAGGQGFDRYRMREAFSRARRPGPFGPGMRGPARGPYRGGIQRMREIIASTALDGLDMTDATYRSVYLPIVRDSVPRSLEVFDFAEPTLVVGKRESSNSPNQALYLMNNPFVIGRSEALANRLTREQQTTADRVQHAFLLTYGRPPTSGERSAMVAFARRFERAGDRDQQGLSTLAALCQSLFAAAEFRYID
jgi:hypothetical protein